MSTAVIIDCIVAAVLIGFLIAGARRGLFLSLAGLLAVVIALVGAGMFATAVTPKAAAYVQPFLEKRVEARVDSALSRNGDSSSAAEPEVSGVTDTGGVEAEKPAVSGETGTSGETASGETGLDAGQLLSLLGMDQDPSASLAQEAQEKVRDTGVSVMTAVVDSLAGTILHVILFVAAFFLLMILLKLLIKAIDAVLKLPGLHFLNHFGGAVLGAAEGALLLFLAIWILRRFGVSFDTKTVESTVLLSFFTTHTPLSALSFL